MSSFFENLKNSVHADVLRLAFVPRAAENFSRYIKSRIAVTGDASIEINGPEFSYLQHPTIPVVMDQNIANVFLKGRTISLGIIVCRNIAYASLALSVITSLAIAFGSTSTIVLASFVISVLSTGAGGGAAWALSTAVHNAFKGAAMLAAENPAVVNSVVPSIAFTEILKGRF